MSCDYADWQWAISEARAVVMKHHLTCADGRCWPTLDADIKKIAREFLFMREDLAHPKGEQR